MFDVPVRIVPQRFAIHRTGECMHSDRAAQPDERYLYFKLDHSRYPIGKQCESRIGDKGPDGDEEGLDVPARHLIFYISTGVAESEKTCLNHSNAGQVAEYLMAEFV